MVRRVTAAQHSAKGIPSTTSVHYLKLMQLWQWAPVFTPVGLVETCRQYGFTGVTVKALDGVHWMGTIESSQYALSSYNDVAYQAAYFHSQGLYYFVWTNPLQPNWERQADMTASLLDTGIDGVMLDVEPYAQFWGPYAPVGLATSFMERIRASSDRWIGLQPDPRPMALQAIRVGEWINHCDAMLGQHYWSDFNTDAGAELAHAASLGNVLGIPVLPTLPGNATGAFPTNQISGFPGYCIWRYGTTPASRMAELGSLPVAGLTTAKFEVRSPTK